MIASDTLRSDQRRAEQRAGENGNANGKTGQVASTPAIITQNEVTAELARASRYSHFVEALIGEGSEKTTAQHRFEKVVSVLRVLFGSKWVRDAK